MLTCCGSAPLTMDEDTDTAVVVDVDVDADAAAPCAALLLSSFFLFRSLFFLVLP